MSKVKRQNLLQSLGLHDSEALSMWSPVDDIGMLCVGQNGMQFVRERHAVACDADIRWVNYI